MFDSIRKYKIWIRFFVIFFAVSVSGVHLDVHFCNGNLAGVKIMSSEEPSADLSRCCASICSAEDPGNCCDDEAVSASLDYDGLALHISYDKEYKYSNHIVCSNHVGATEITKFSNTGCRAPPWSGLDRRIQFQSFLC